MRTLFSFVSLVFIVIISIVLYSATVRGVRGDIDHTSGKRFTSIGMPFESSHERAPYALLLSIVNNKQINLSEELAEFGSPDVGITNGKYFILFPPGVSFILYPFYTIGKYYELSQVISYASISLYAIGSIVILYFISRQILNLSIAISAIVPIIWAFATTSWSYAVTIYQHIPITFFLLLSFYAAWRFRQKKFLSFFWAALVWFSYGVGLFIDFPSVFLGLPIMFYFFLSSLNIEDNNKKQFLTIRPAFIFTSVFFIVLVAAHGYYNHIAFGDYKKFGQSFSRYEGKEKYEAKLALKEAEATISGTLQTSRNTSNPFSVFDEERVVRGLESLTYANDRGLFFYSPVLILGIIAWFFKKKYNPFEQNILISLCIVNILLYASFGDPWGGWAYGPRYLIPGMAFISLFVGIFLHKFFLPWVGRFVFIPLFIFSTAISVLGVLTTNVIPPKVEGIPLGLQYNYIANLFYLFEGKTGVFAYKEWFSNSITLSQYGAVLLAIINTTVFILLLIESITQRPEGYHFPEFFYLRKGLRFVSKKLRIKI